MLPWMSKSAVRSLGSSPASSSSSRNWKIRSAAATVICSWLEMLAIWVMGWVKLRTYCTKAWMPPMVMEPPAAIEAPTMQMTT